jgi:glutathione synthase/RimK-type ligase-like ATP-grasp enzyme
MVRVAAADAGSVGQEDRAVDGAMGQSCAVIDQLVREGARRMLAEALQAEVDAYISQFVDERDENGRRLVVRGRQPSASYRCRPARGRWR